MNPAQYYRQRNEWKKWLGKKGVVVGSTMVTVGAPTRASFTPYAYVLVEFGEGTLRSEFMGAGNEELRVGDVVECVLRKTGDAEKFAIIEYGIKVRKVE